jgi:DNA-binding IclR family transcriptional regulator
VSPSIAQRLVATLAGFDYLEQSLLSHKYRIGYKAFQIGNAYLTGSDISELSLPELRMMADKHRLNAFLGVLRDGAVVYLATIQAAGPIAIRNVPGSRTFLHSTALGKALIADCSDADIAALLGPQPYRRLTAKTKTRLQPLLADLRAARRLGYTLSDGENLDGVLSIGAALRDSTGRAIAAISGALPRGDLRGSDIAEICRVINQAAARISRRLGAPLTSDGRTVEAMAAG